MITYLLRRVGFLGLTLLLTSIIIFTTTQLLPGDVARVILGREASQVQVDKLREQLGLNDPPPLQSASFVHSVHTPSCALQRSP